MHRLACLLIPAFLFASLDICEAAEPSQKLSAEQASALFAAKIKPLLKNKCVGCHSEGEYKEANLDLRTREAMLAGGDSGKVVIPGNAAKSLLYEAVTWKSDEIQMPPKERNRLSAEEVELLRQWIDAGAPWPSGQPAVPGNWENENNDGVQVATSGGLSPDWTHRKYEPEALWAYQPIRNPKVPTVQGMPVQNPVDAFVGKRLAEKDLAPAAAADKRTLIRRVTIGLTGLPPSPEQVEAFLKDDSPNAFQKVVDRLLDSKHYGEQMARHWLDVVRYADTSGFANDFERPHAWRYRDYVIRSFNADKPYDRFVIEQLAGDELNPEDPENLIAVGYLRMGPWEHTGMSVAAVTRQYFLDDITHSVGVTFLGQGMRCARCHDHKFDPLPTRDYYRLQAVFAPVQFAHRQVAFLPAENTDGFAKQQAIAKKRLSEARRELSQITRKRDQAVKEFLKEKGVKNVNALPKEERPSRHFGLTSEEMTLQKVLRKRIDYFEREVKRFEPYAFSVYSGPLREIRSNRVLHEMPSKMQGNVQAVHILSGGSLEAPMDEVSPGVLSAVAGSNDKLEATDWNTIPAQREGRRLELARWIASRENTLTSRVIVNRIWQMHFGNRGIVATPNNLGKMGARPTHPELLDWLATWFMGNGWSIKKLHRLLLTSATYQRSSRHPDRERIDEVDPKNELLAFYPVRRLAAEELRDGMLAVSGELNPEMGGPGMHPEINWEVALQPRHIMGSVAPAYQPSTTPQERNRRTLYAFRYRTLADPMLEVFNQPGSETSCECRDETTVTPQVFALFNGQFAHDRALAMARRLEEQAGSLEAQVRLAFRLAYGRAVTPNELRASVQHVQAMQKHHQQHPPQKQELPQKVRREMIEELTGDTVRWEEKLDLMEDYQRDLKPWDVGPETRALAELCLVLLNSNEFVYVR